MKTLEQKILEHYAGRSIRKTFDFGKIAYTSKRKSNTVDVTIELSTRDSKVEFTACGNIWNHLHSDIYSGGQNLDEIAKYVHDKTFLKIYDLHKHWHLNTLHSGTKEQEDFLDNYFEKAGRRYDYDEAKKALEENGLLTVKLEDGSDYIYGHGWLYEPIPEDDLTVILDLLGVKEQVLQA